MLGNVKRGNVCRTQKMFPCSRDVSMTANLNNLLGELVLMCTDTDVFSVRILILLYCGIIVGVVIKP